MDSFTWLNDLISNIGAAKAVQNIPQTQQDLRTLAQSAEYLQSPQVRAKLDDAEKFAYAQLILQGISAAAALGIFLATVIRK